MFITRLLVAVLVIAGIVLLCPVFGVIGMQTLDQSPTTAQHEGSFLGVLFCVVPVVVAVFVVIWLWPRAAYHDAQKAGRLLAMLYHFLFK